MRDCNKIWMQTFLIKTIFYLHFHFAFNFPIFFFCKSNKSFSAVFFCLWKMCVCVCWKMHNLINNQKGIKTKLNIFLVNHPCVCSSSSSYFSTLRWIYLHYNSWYGQNAKEKSETKEQGVIIWKKELKQKSYKPTNKILVHKNRAMKSIFIILVSVCERGISLQHDC